MSVMYLCCVTITGKFYQDLSYMAGTGLNSFQVCANLFLIIVFEVGRILIILFNEGSDLERI